MENGLKLKQLNLMNNMKATEAPEKIYLQVCGDCEDNDCKNCKFEDLEGNITWCKDKIFDKDIEYTRIDAFIEKACDWIEKNIGSSLGISSCAITKSFKEAMEN